MRDIRPAGLLLMAEGRNALSETIRVQAESGFRWNAGAERCLCRSNYVNEDR